MSVPGASTHLHTPAACLFMIHVHVQHVQLERMHVHERPASHTLAVQHTTKHRLSPYTLARYGLASWQAGKQGQCTQQGANWPAQHLQAPLCPCPVHSPLWQTLRGLHGGVSCRCVEPACAARPCMIWTRHGLHAHCHKPHTHTDCAACTASSTPGPKHRACWAFLLSTGVGHALAMEPSQSCSNLSSEAVPVVTALSWHPTPPDAHTDTAPPQAAKRDQVLLACDRSVVRTRACSGTVPHTPSSSNMTATYFTTQHGKLATLGLSA